MNTKYHVELRNGRYLSAPPIEGKQRRTTSEISRAYDFSNPSAAHVARDIPGAQVVSYRPRLTR